MARQWRRRPSSNILLQRCRLIILFSANVPVTKWLYQSSRGRQVCRFRVRFCVPVPLRFPGHIACRLTGAPFAPSLLSGPVFPVPGVAKALIGLHRADRF
ncbi:hypothetical protein Agau_C201212 [Agrobacterium tumefaciens F2]|nr:hypothetical protein Agau_C201212 [Agrobacterium tumefaciens F2]